MTARDELIHAAALGGLVAFVLGAAIAGCAMAWANRQRWRREIGTGASAAVGMVALRPGTAEWLLRTLQALPVGAGQSFVTRRGSLVITRDGRWRYQVSRRLGSGRYEAMGDHSLAGAHALLLQELEVAYAA